MTRTEELIQQLYAIVDELESLYPGRRFTPDGHLVGSIGEVYAAENYGLKLFVAGHPGHDAIDSEGRQWQIKVTGARSIGIRACPDFLLVLKINRNGKLDEIYRGPGEPAWDAAGRMQKNGQRPLTIARLNQLPKNG
jgi:hypothetical protein